MNNRQLETKCESQKDFVVAYEEDCTSYKWERKLETRLMVSSRSSSQKKLKFHLKRDATPRARPRLGTNGIVFHEMSTSR